MRATLILSALAVVVPALGAPTVIPITKRAGPVKADSYIIKFKDGSSKDILSNVLAQPGSAVTYDYSSVFNGVAVKLPGSDLRLVQGLFGIEYIEQDAIMSLSYEQGIDGLPSVAERSEISSDPVLGKRWGNGQGVIVYGIDTGIYTEHNCFGGRASWGATFGEGYENRDGNGHGTHTAGTAVGKVFGQAPGAKVVAIKVLSDQGSGATSDIMAGVNFAYQEFSKSKKPSVVNMSLGGPGLPIQSLGTAIKNAIKGGLHFSIAAGNDNKLASLTTPANVQEANTIGAIDANNSNQKASFSNYGGLIDVWAPGVNILSAWIDGPDSTLIASGTSMAAPYVAGIIAAKLSDKELTPAEMSKQLKDNAAPDVTFSPQDIAAAAISNHKRAQMW